MTPSQALTRFGILTSVVIFAHGAFAGEQHLELKMVSRAPDVKAVEAPNVAGQTMAVGKYFGVAFSRDGRIAINDIVSVHDLLNGTGWANGYSTYTFEDGSSITASVTSDLKEGVVHGTYEILSGTGMYSEATGTGSFDSLPIKLGGDARLYDVKLDIMTP